MFQGKPVVVQTSNFGGAQGTAFNDNQDATNFPNSDPGVLINPQHPITQMQISAGWVVDSISTTYRLTDGKTKTIQRGSTMTPGSPNVKVITLGENEIISQVCGFSGNYEYYKQSLLIQMSVVITDTMTGAIRVVGPMGGGNGTAQGTFWSVGTPLCFAGFQTAGSAQTGMSGLSIIKSSMVE
ncbi:hypothetical protein DFH09DRAFT_1051051 [Mycena vulgaris]|nr:hypothetical protein DFH09DRAFT_1051051 [Mycena vulgaris]